MKTRGVRVDFLSYFQNKADLRPSKIKLLSYSDEYDVDRIITKSTSKGYLVKWKGFSLWDSTWEPLNSRCSSTFEYIYRYPVVNNELIQSNTDNLLFVIRERLGKRTGRCGLVAFRHDVFRHLFGLEKTRLFSREDFEHLNFPDCWDQFKGERSGRKISFPMRMTLKVKFCKGHPMPYEAIDIEFVTERFSTI
ncbi:unnamed protein product [Owenia fusiformis]|uniref:Uncharacterized protein n=1 Tax=Owenia fusiformis TaxID=6347 RepID=A0A8J1UST8_OWEFU|nr:unnamed protein product [Owenia fusiformis]